MINFTRYQRFYIACTGALCALVGGAVIFGWYTHTTGLLQIRPEFPAMRFNTALSVLSCGISLLGLAAGRRGFVLLGAIWPTMVGLLTLTEYLSGSNLGIDNFLFNSYLDAGATHSGRMGFNTAASFLLSGCDLLVIGWAAWFRFRPILISGLGLLTLGIALSAFVVYATSMLTGSRWGLTAPMAVHTASTLLLLSTSLLISGWRDYTSRDPGVARSLRECTVAWVVLGLSLFVAGWAWHATSQSATDRAHTRFNEVVHQAHSVIVNRMRDYEQILIGTRGLFAASRSVERDEWRAYVASMDIERRYPGIQAIGFGRYLVSREKDRYLADLRGEGFPDVRIWPEGHRAHYMAVTYTDPFDARNPRMLGYDAFADPVRRAAMERARDTGDPVMSGRVRLGQESGSDVQYGFLLFVPVYKNGMPLTTRDERRAALWGFSYVVFRMSDLMNGVLGGTARDIGFQIFDGAGTAADAIVYGDASDSDASGYRPTFSTVISSEISGHTWTFVFSTWPSFDAAVYTHEPVVILLGGLLGSLLLFGITWSLATTGANAQHLAERMTQALRKSEAQFRAVADHANDAIVSTDDRGRIVAWNKSAGNIFGYGEEESLGQPLSMLISEHAWQAQDAALTRVASGEDQGRFGETLELIGRRKDGREFPLELSLSSWTEGGKRFYTGIIRDITERKRVQERLDHLATHDALTGLPNRTLFADRLEQALTRPAWNKRLVAVMFLDLDRFKAINDTLGHDAGDLLLMTVASRLKAAVRDGDTVARQGGDEFTIILIDMAQIEDVALVAQKLLNAMAQPFDLHGHQMTVTFSIGIACCPVDGTDASTLLKHADTALYRAKERGRNNFQIYSAA